MSFSRPNNSVKRLSIFLLIILFTAAKSNSQHGAEVEKNFIALTKYVSGIGTIFHDTIVQNNKKTLVKRFVTVGSGLVTYVKYDTNIITSIITASHVIDFFVKNKLKSIFIRPSWADTLKTSDYYGVEIPFINPNGSPNTFMYPDSGIDLACIFLLPRYYDVLYQAIDLRENTKIFPYNSMTVPYIGDEVFIGGYAGHIQSQIQNKFYYSIATFKVGRVAWRPSMNITNSDLSHITLIESNATFGNSGGPVFSLQEKPELVGILVAGLDEEDPIFADGRPVIDPISGKNVIAKRRAGVSIIERAEFVRKLIEHVQMQIIKFNYKIYLY